MLFKLSTISQLQSMANMVASQYGIPSPIVRKGPYDKIRFAPDIMSEPSNIYIKDPSDIAALAHEVGHLITAKELPAVEALPSLRFLKPLSAGGALLYLLFKRNPFKALDLLKAYGIYKSVDVPDIINEAIANVYGYRAAEYLHPGMGWKVTKENLPYFAGYLFY